MGDDGDYVHPTDSLSDVSAVLDRARYVSARIGSVAHCIAVHDEYAYRGFDHEAEVFRDAENIDAMCIARDLAISGVFGNPLWDPSAEDSSSPGPFRG